MSDIDSYIQRVDPANGGNHRTKAFPFVEEGLILVQKTERDFDELKRKIASCKALGVSIPLYIDYKYDGENYWILEELACGEEFETIVRNGAATEVFANMPYEHIEKYIRDLYLLGTNGIGVETRRRNIFYDRTKGFTTIDVGLLSNPTCYSLQRVNHIFCMVSRVLLPPFSDDEYGKSVREKTMLNIMRGFETAHPFFNKYKRWIYRGSPSFAQLIEAKAKESTPEHVHEKNGALTISAEEYQVFTNLINELIDSEAEEKIDQPETLFHNKKTSYIELLASSIPYCTSFGLFNPAEQTLDDYIKTAVYGKIKTRFFEDTENDNLRDLYYRIRRKEMDPVGIYNPEYLNEQIATEIPPKGAHK